MTNSSDEAVQEKVAKYALDCFASLAMTIEKDSNASHIASRRRKRRGWMHLEGLPVDIVLLLDDADAITCTKIKLGKPITGKGRVLFA